METMRVMEESLLDCDDQARTGKGLAAEVTSPTGNSGEGDSLLEADSAGSERPTLEPTGCSSGVPWEVAGGAEDHGRTGGVDIRSSTADSGGGAERD
ncbi:hypothetical protein DY000_02014724 [Brassica cretica]|uniref:Uncharacterized protein n=1 Tax=Brassica cretica TaxID=69181 RepID=A0ABQ7CX20_BRACR|nr:hypothetical protein DY000_02014724 [Brassica cretica]